jgi:lysophospholipase L1-like esterase
MNSSAFPTINRASTLAGLSPYGYRGDARRVHSALHRSIELNQNLSIVVLGASVTIGFGLGGTWFRDRYTTLLGKYLVDVFKVNVTVTNLAIRATTSDTQCSVLFHKKLKKLKRASLVLVDISVNDRPAHKHIKNEAKKASHVDSLDASSSSSSAEHAQEVVSRREKVGAEGRKLMQLLQHYLPATVGIVYFETFVSGGR